METWKSISGYEGLYEVSDLGNVRALNYRGWGFVRNMIPSKTGKDYLKGKPYLAVGLTKNGKRKSFKIHRLVLTSFLGESNLHGDHINGITTDNRLVNLRYCTNRENKNFSKIGISSKYVGVYFNKNRYVARIRLGKERLCLGRFKNEEEAAEAYRKKLEEVKSV